MENLDELLNDALLERPKQGIIYHKAKTYRFKLFKRVFEFKTYIPISTKSFLSCDEILCSNDAINKRVGLMTEEEYGKVEEKCKKYQEEFEKKEGWKPDSHYKK